MRTLPTIAIALLPSLADAGACERYLAERHLETMLQANAALARPESSRVAAHVFFNALPDSFACYKALFDEPGPLSEAPVMDEVFPRLRAGVDARAYLRKLVRLCVGASWQADQINHLQHAARAVLTDTPSAFVQELQKLNDGQETSVWDFLFGGPHPSSQPLSSGLRQRICRLSARSCERSQSSYARALVREQNEH